MMIDRLSLETLDMLMFLSLSAHHVVNEVDWNATYDLWKKMKTINPFPLGKYIYIFNYVTPNTF